MCVSICFEFDKFFLFCFSLTSFAYVKKKNRKKKERKKEEVMSSTSNVYMN